MSLSSRKRVLKQLVWDYLLENPCVDCKQSNPVLLEFDHIKEREKKAAVSKLVQKGYSWKTVSEEIAKCEVRCVTCHRLKTSSERRYFRGDWLAGQEYKGERDESS